MQKSQCLQVPAGEEGEPKGLPNLLKEEEKEEDEEEKKEDDDDKEEMEGKRKDGEDMQDSLVVEESMIVKFPLVPFATCLLPLQLLLQGSFRQEEVKKPHRRDAQRPNILHTLLAYFLKKNIFVRHCLVYFPSS